MDAAGIDAAVIAPIATKPSQVESINNFVTENRHERIIPFGSIHPDYEGIEAELERAAERGIKGIKLHPDYQLFYPNEERLSPIYRSCEALNLPILFHAGDDVGIATPGHGLPRLFAKTFDRFPGLRAILAHLGGWEMWDQAYKFIAGRDTIFLDTSYIEGFIDEERLYAIIEKHGAEKIVFGTDSPWGSLEKHISFIKGLSLSDEAKEAIFHTNAEGLLAI
jgi:hypothetical protein